MYFEAFHGEFHLLIPIFNLEHHFDMILLKSKLSARQRFVTVVNAQFDEPKT